MIICTTFSESGYNNYGKLWIESLSRYISDSNIKVHLYVDFFIENLPKNFTIIPLQLAYPDVQSFRHKVESFFKKNSKGQVIAEKTIKFSFKSFVIIHALKNADKKEYVVWLDGDVETKSLIQSNDFQEVLGNKFCACQTEKQYKRFPHIETGILIFDCSKEDTQLFRFLLEKFYTSHKLFNLKKPYDGYIVGYILSHYEFDYFDLNDNIIIKGKSGSVDETFQHYFLKERFVHHIGNVAKSKL